MREEDYWVPVKKQNSSLTQTHLVSRVATAQEWPKQLPVQSHVLELPAGFDSVNHCILLSGMGFTGGHVLGLTLTYLGVHSGHLLVPHQLSTRVSRVWCLCSLTFTKPRWSQSSTHNSFISTLTSKWEEPKDNVPSPLRHGRRTRTSELTLIKLSFCFS